MSDSELLGRHPEVSMLIPHSGEMCLLSRVLTHDTQSTTCAVEPGEHVLFQDEGGRVPAFVALEYMAQCIAVHAGMEAVSAGRAPRVGYLLGSRRLRLYAQVVPNAAAIQVSARYLRGRPGLGAMSFVCELVSNNGGGTASVIANGTLNVGFAQEGAGSGSVATS